MIRTLTGENSYGLRSELRSIVEGFLAEHGDLALERIDGQEAPIDKVNEALTGLPFLSDKKMVVLESPGSNKQFAEQVEKMLAAIPESTEVVIVEPKLDKRSAYFKYLKKKTDFVEFADMDQGGLSRWLSEEAKQKGGNLSVADARYLVDRVGANQKLLSNELEKLLLYDAKISRQSIDLLTEPAPQSTVFQLLEAAFAGNKKRALGLYSEQRALKVEPQQIIAMLAWQLHVLAVIKTAGKRSSAEIAREAKLNPYVIDKSRRIADRLTLVELKNLIRDLLDIDVRSKSTAIDMDEALQHYLISLGS